jgi:preprotein translocase subunit SecA
MEKFRALMCVLVMSQEVAGRMKYRTKLEQLQHEFLEVKHGLEPDPPTLTSNSITYARFFRRFQKVAGMTGTAMDVSNVLWDVYSLSVCSLNNEMTVNEIRGSVNDTEDGFSCQLGFLTTWLSHKLGWDFMSGLAK